MLAITSHYFICEIKSEIKNQCHLSMNKETLTIKKQCHLNMKKKHGTLHEWTLTAVR